MPSWFAQWRWLNHEASPLKPHLDADVGLLDRVERTIQSGRYRPAFGAELEARFEADTCEKRVRSIRCTIFLGLAIFNTYIVAGCITAPDLAVLNAALRIGAMTPLGLLIAWAVGRVGGPLREAMCGLGMLAATAIPIVIFWLGDGPLVTLSAASIWLSVIFANITLPLRFLWACIVSAVTALAVLAVLASKTGYDLGTSGVIMLDLITGILISLVATYRIEAATRRDYLLNLRETLRGKVLAADNTALAQLSATDPLTGLANRRAFATRLATLWQASLRGQPFVVVLMDVDHFKRFNDRYGHGAGDACLHEIGAILTALVPGPNDLVARYGGEEFALLLPDRSIAEGIAMAERLRLGIAARALPHADRRDALGYVTISVGAAASTGPALSAAAVVEAADIALYQAKSRGRNRTWPPRASGIEARTAARAAEGRPGHDEPGEPVRAAPRVDAAASS